MTLPGSVTTWIDRLKAGDVAAAEALWQRYFAQLVELAHHHLAQHVRRAADGEDVALSAFASFCAGVKAGRFPRLSSRDDLWQLLFVITLRQARKLAHHETRQKRDSRRSLIAGALGDLPEADLDRLAGDSPDPALAAEAADQTRRLLELLPGEDLRAVVKDTLEGYTTAEIAAHLHCGCRTVARRRERIRQYWQSIVEE
jgi:DNA-directed RNA polymerase specialized sigma24 family protein